MDKIAICAVCGKEFVRNCRQSKMKYCSEPCRRIVKNEATRRFRERNKVEINQQRKEKRQKIKKKVSNNDIVLQINALARKEGLSYGQYVAKYGV